MKKVLRSVAYGVSAWLPKSMKYVVARELAAGDIDRFQLLAEPEVLARIFRTYNVDCVFDVGANAGQYGYMLRTAAHFTGRIISFEPIPEMAEKVRDLSANDPLWTVEELALSAENGTKAFNVMKANQLSSLGNPSTQEVGIYENENLPDRVIDVAVQTIATVYPRLAKEFGFRQPFLKMDTQGFDLQVVRGAGEELAQFVGLQSELSFRRIYQNTPKYSEAISAYAEHGFDISAMFNNNIGAFPYLIDMDGVFLRRDLMQS